MQHHERIEQLDHHLNQIIYLLKQPGKSHFSAFNPSKNYLYEKTWTLVIGTEGSGKTTFLQQSDLNVIQGQTEDNTDCSAWFSQDGVFIELPSLSLVNPEENATLNHFIQTIKGRRRKKPFDNILLTINMYSFIQEYDRYIVYLESLKEQLQKLLNPYLSEKIHIYIVFTHMDKVAGFCDFFSEFSTYQTTHALGYLFDEYASKKKLVEQNEKKYDRLLGRLHENLITLLHKTRNNLTRYLIREFPQQLDSLRNMIRSSVSFTSEINESFLKVKGVFFTSACQSGICIDRISIPISQSYQLTLSNHFPQAYRQQPYFIKGIIKMMAKDHNPEDTRFAQYRREHKLVAYTGYAMAALFLLFIGIGYYFTVQHLNTAESALNQYQKLANEEPLTSIVPELYYLATARSTLNKINPWFISLNDFNKTKHWVNTQYYKELSQQFLPQVAHQIEEKLLSERNPAIQYAALKAYLMLGEPQYLDLIYLKHWLHHSLHLSSEAELESSLLQPFPGINLNKNIIEQVRSNLNLLPVQYLTYMMVKNNPSEFIQLKNDAFIVPVSPQGIPDFYMRNGFEKEYTQTIPQITKQMSNENWILKNPALAEELLPTLMNRVRDLYTADYLNWWRLFVYHTQPKPLNTIDEAAIYFKALNTPKISPLSQMLIFIKKNTASFEGSDKNLSATQKVFNRQIASQLTALNNISPESIQMASSPLSDLSRYFSMAATNKNPSFFAFNTAKQRFNQFNQSTNLRQEGALNKLRLAAQNAPEPTRQWLKQIASNSWFLILSETKNYINQQWTKLIIPEYAQTIQNRFPIDASAEQDISLANFGRFFNHQGTLSRFFEDYLKPFLNTEKAQWTLKKVDNFELPFRSEIITEFERANVIREMFFSGNTTTPSINFTIQTTELQPIVSSITLDINGKTLIASQTNKNTQYFNWPGNYMTIPVTLSLQNITGEQFQVTEYGPWGIFRLLAHANIQPIINNPQMLQLVFDLNGNAAEYLLRTNNPLNPFIPEIIQAFHLPESVF